MNFAGVVPGDTPFKNLSADPPPGIGPYRFTRSVPNREFVMEKDPNFNIPGIPKGNVDTITTRIVKSAERQTQDVISGELDFMQDPPPADLLPQVKAEYSDRYEEQDAINTYYFFMNSRSRRSTRRKSGRPSTSPSTRRRSRGCSAGGSRRDATSCRPDMAGYEKIDPCPYGDPTSRPTSRGRAR